MTKDASERAGHRSLPHTADLRVEAWGPTREQCIAEAVTAVVETFVDVGDAQDAVTRTAHLRGAADEDLLVAVLDEVVYLLDTTGLVPVGVAVRPDGTGAEVRFRMVPSESLSQVGAVPKAVSLHDLHLRPGPHGWTCAVTLDV